MVCALHFSAMWQNFRARLPYLYDPWSERLPDPPTLMQAMIAISILVEGGSVLAGALFAATGKQNIVAAQTMAYGICAVIVSIGMSNFLGNRGVRPEQVWCWSDADEESTDSWWRGTRNQKALLLGAATGVLLAGCAIAFIALLRHFPPPAKSFSAHNSRWPPSAFETCITRTVGGGVCSLRRGVFVPRPPL